MLVIAVCVDYGRWRHCTALHLYMGVTLSLGRWRHCTAVNHYMGVNLPLVIDYYRDYGKIIIEKPK